MTRPLLLIVCVLLVLPGCVGKPDISISPAQVEWLKEVQEIRILYHPLIVIDHLLAVSRGYGKYATSYTVHGKYMTFEDPLAGVQSQFAAGLMKRLELHNFSTAQRVEPRSEHPHSLGEHSSDRGLVFTFDTRYWQVNQWSPNYNLLNSLLGMPFRIGYTLKYSARGTLFSREAANLLWQAHCEISFDFRSPGDIYLSELIADEHSVIHEKRREAETKCAEQLLEKFFP